jgi:hypothetical protein
VSARLPSNSRQGSCETHVDHPLRRGFLAIVISIAVVVHECPLIPDPPTPFCRHDRYSYLVPLPIVLFTHPMYAYYLPYLPRLDSSPAGEDGLLMYQYFRVHLYIVAFCKLIHFQSDPLRLQWLRTCSASDLTSCVDDDIHDLPVSGVSEWSSPKK